MNFIEYALKNKKTRTAVFLCLWVYMFFFTACAGQHPAKISVDHSPKFANSHMYEEDLDTLRRAAKLVLQDLINDSKPSTKSDTRTEGDKLSTGWVYSQSRDKYVLVNFNGSPKRVPLQVRRKYKYALSSSLSGSSAVATADEEIQTRDEKNGAPFAWKSSEVDPSVYQMLIQKLSEKVRSN